MKKTILLLAGLLVLYILSVAEAVEDIQPPILQSVSVTPSVIDVGGEVTVTIEAADAMSGVSEYGLCYARLLSPSGTKARQVSLYHVSGDTYSGTRELGEPVEYGTWQVDEIYLVDLADNEKKYFHSIDYSATFIVSEDLSNTYPVAEAGKNISARAGERIILCAYGSYDPDGKIVSYKWRDVKGNILGEGAMPAYIYPGYAEQLIILDVTDNQGATATDEVRIFNTLLKDLQEQTEKLEAQNQRQQTLIDRIVSWPPIRQWLRWRGSSGNKWGQ